MARYGYAHGAGNGQREKHRLGNGQRERHGLERFIRLSLRRRIWTRYPLHGLWLFILRSRRRAGLWISIQVSLSP